MGKRRKPEPKPSPGMPTPERMRHGHVQRERRATEVGKGGDTIAAVERAPLVLDALYEEGALGQGDQAWVRHAAALWLHEAFHKAGLAENVTAEYEVKGRENKRRFEDARRWNEGAYLDTVKAMKGFGAVLTRVCCHDARPHHDDVAELRMALDALAEHRGISG